MPNSLMMVPIISEKTFALASSRQTYTFEVSITTSKIQIAQAVAREFKVTVTSVRTVRAKGKSKRTLVKRGSRYVRGQRSDIKKAYVTLKEGDNIKLFEESQADGN
jgi:large subunit ribosomal protein L23